MRRPGRRSIVTKVQVGHMDAWRKKSLLLMEYGPGDLAEDAVSGLDRSNGWHVVRE